MSWFFKKKHPKPSTSDSYEDLTIAAQEENFPTSSNIQDGLPYPNSGLYPFIGDVPTSESQKLPTDSSKQNQQADTQHYLNDVPFKLCGQLNNNLNNDFELDILRVNEILSFIQRIEEQNFDYDFSLEKSVISEMDSANDE